MDDNDLGCLVQIIGWPILFLFIFGWTWFAASNEAATYNRLTGANVSTWDALWVDLRIVEGMEK